MSKILVYQDIEHEHASTVIQDYFFKKGIYWNHGKNYQPLRHEENEFIAVRSSLSKDDSEREILRWLEFPSSLIKGLNKEKAEEALIKYYDCFSDLQRASEELSGSIFIPLSSLLVKKTIDIE